MSEENKGPVYGVDLPDSLLMPLSGFRQIIPRRDDLQLVRDLGKIGARTVAALEVALSLVAAIDRGGYDVSVCMDCGAPVVCIPDGLALCRTCAERAGQ
jgi:hypothetical protein